MVKKDKNFVDNAARIMMIMNELTAFGLISKIALFCYEQTHIVPTKGFTKLRQPSRLNETQV